MMLQRLLAPMIRVGRLTVAIGTDAPFTLGARGDGRPAPDIRLRIADHATARRLALDPEYQFGEAWMDGTLSLERGTLGELMELVGRNLAARPASGMLARSREWLLHNFGRANSLARARRNVAHHYDLPESFYRLFLDADLQYSCAWFADAGLSLDAAQVAKKAHIAAKLALRPGLHILDIGCGWGGLALALAKLADVQVTGITLSAEQLRIARQRAEQAGLQQRVQFLLMDYRQMQGRFDRIVSVGMFEHVGRRHFNAYFAAIERLLADDGVALVHAIGRKDRGSGSNPWLREHIFPGGYIAAVSEALRALERTGLWLTDAEILRLHYAETLRHWRQRLAQHQQTVEAIHDARFYRMWEFYLAFCEMGFRYNGLLVFQLQIARRIDTLPLSRDYLATAERQLRARLLAAAAPAEIDPSSFGRKEVPQC